MPYVTWSAGGEEYRLRLTTKATVDLEKKLGRSPLSAFVEMGNGTLPTTSLLATVLQAALQPLGHGFTETKTYELLDRYFEDGHNMYDLVPVLMEVFRVSGLIPKESAGEADDEKNG